MLIVSMSEDVAHWFIESRGNVVAQLVERRPRDPCNGLHDQRFEYRPEHKTNL